MPLGCGAIEDSEPTAAGGSSSGGSSSGGASSGGASSGGASSGGPVIPTFADSLCSDEGYRPLENLNVEKFGAGGVEYIEIRREIVGGDAPAQVLASVGFRCQSAPDKPACEAAVAATHVAEGFESLPDALLQAGNAQPTISYLLVTQGGAVSTVTTAAQLGTLLGPIDTLGEAALAAYVRNHEIVCPPQDPHSTGEAYTTAGQTAASFRLTTFTGFACGEGTSRDALQVSVAPAGAVTIESRTVIQRGEPGCAVGRRPDGLHSNGATGADDLGAFFAEIAHLESASVTAFAQIERELGLLGAPRRLRRGARKARADEVRHTRITSRLAERFGARVQAAEVAEVAPRERFRFALDNAVEGCVKETFGALLAEAQAARASDPEIARAMRAIAREETEHAALSWDMAAWIEPTLSDEERATLAAAKRAAVADLERVLTRRYQPAVEKLAGMPAPAQAKALLDAVRPHLLAAA